MTKGALWVTALLAAHVASTAAAAAETSFLANALALDPPEFQLGDLEIRLGGIAAGALFTSSQSGGPARVGGYDAAGVSGLTAANIRVQRTLDNGIVFGGRGEFLLYHDDLSSDKYGNDTVERLYLFVQTGFGRAEIGEQDGAAYTLGLVGPLPDEQVSLEKNRNISLFRNPVTGRDFGAFFRQQTNVQSSSNYAKFNYVSPRLFGIQVGAAFTPEVVRSPLPYTGNPNNGPNRQTNLWEVAASYTGYLSSVALRLSGGLAHGSP